jgi:energy-coupling factor transporter ATP-binding protein EcfA2
LDDYLNCQTDYFNVIQKKADETNFLSVNFVVEVEHLSKGFGDRLLIDDLSFTLPRNGIVGVIGPNGAGKTTLFKTIMGMEAADSGSVKVGETVKIAYVDQSRGGIDPKKSLWEVVSDGLDFIKVGQVEKQIKEFVSNNSSYVSAGEVVVSGFPLAQKITIKNLKFTIPNAALDKNQVLVPHLEATAGILASEHKRIAAHIEPCSDLRNTPNGLHV